MVEIINPFKTERDLSFLEQFTIPDQETANKQQVLLELLSPNIYNHVLVIGRFQPLHFGHIHLFKWAAKLGKGFTIAVGSANKLDEDNPFSPEERISMIMKALKKKELKDVMMKLNKIVTLDDYEDNDQKWIDEVNSKIERVNAVVGNNDWVNRIFRAAGINAIEISLLERGSFEGRKIREQLRLQNLL